MKKLAIVMILSIATIIMIGIIVAAGLQMRARSESGNSKGETMLNYYEHEFDTDDLKDIDISYISEKIRLYPSDSNKIIIKEYLNTFGSNKPAIIAEGQGRLKVSSGKSNSPLGLFNIPFGEEKIEVYLPAEYSKSLKLSTVSGSIQSDSNWAMEAFRASTTSGSIKLKGIGAGTLELNTVSGGIQAGGIINGGDINTTSGSVKLVFQETGGRLEISTVSGAINLTVPEEEGFSFKASTVSGRITTFFPVQGGKKSVTGTNQDSGKADLIASTVSGSITVEGM